MGMYTSLRGVVEVKQEYIDLARILSNRDYESNQKTVDSKYPFVKEYFKTDRSESIPSNKELQWPFEDEQNFFKPRVENRLFYFSADLKNDLDKTTRLTPIQSFFKNILENIADRILLLETNYEEHWTVYQYNFSMEIINTIEMINQTNKEDEYSYGWVEREKSESIDIFEEYKRENRLRIFD